MQILLEIEGIKSVCGVVVLTVLQSDRRARLVVEVYQQPIAETLGDNAAAFQRVDVFDIVYGLARAASGAL